jgi:uncharacterized protein with HEPN domain
MPSRRPARRFTDIIDNIDAIKSHIGDLDEQAFVGNRLVIDAVERCLSRISEAAVKLGDDAARLTPEIPWRSIRGLGNQLRHAYDVIEAAVVWEIVIDDLPTLRVACERALVALRAEGAGDDAEQDER